MIFIIDNVRTKILAQPSEINDLYYKIGYKQKIRNHFTKKYSSVWRSFVIPSKKDNQLATLPTGLALIYLKNHLDIEVHDVRQIPQPQYNKPQEIEGLSLRDYQIESVEAGILEGRGIFALATNAGKSAVACSLIKTIGQPTLYIVHLKVLLEQMAETLCKALPHLSIGIIGKGQYDLTEDNDVIVAMMQSLGSMLRSSEGRSEFKHYLSPRPVIIIDECHHLRGSTLVKILRCSNAYYRFGLSGTPEGTEVGDLMRLQAYTGPILKRIKNQELIGRGISAKPTVIVIDADFTAEENYSRFGPNEWRDCYNQGIVYNTKRNAHIIETARQSANQGKPTLIFVNEVKHGLQLKTLLEECGETFHFLFGAVDDYTRNRIKNSFASNSLPILIASPIFDEGVDVPAIKSAILAGGGKSPIKALQRIGRALRKKDIDNTVGIYDFSDHHSNILFRHFKQRLRVYRNEGFEVKLEER